LAEGRALSSKQAWRSKIWNKGLLIPGVGLLPLHPFLNYDIVLCDHEYPSSGKCNTFCVCAVSEWKRPPCYETRRKGRKDGASSDLGLGHMAQFTSWLPFLLAIPGHPARVGHLIEF
jgi:hypothetical protein